MSFFYPSPAAVARTRRARESMKSNAGGSAGRRAKDTSKPRDEKSTPSSSPPASHTSPSELPPDVSHPENILSRNATPSTSVRHQHGMGTSGVYHLSIQPETPAALQKYLDIDGGAELEVEHSHTSYPATLIQSLPDLKTTQVTVENASCEDAQSVRSEPTEQPQDRPTYANGPEPGKAESPPSLTSAGSLTGQSEFMQERSHTPPPPALMATQSYSPPPYMSPIPVRAHPYTQNFLSYQGGSGYPMGHGGLPPPEPNPPIQMHHQYYADYATRYHHPTPSQMQRIHSQEPTSAPQRKSNRRSGSHMAAEDDLSSLLGRINMALPDFHTLLDRCDDASSQLSGEPRSRRQSETQFKEAMREKEAHITKLHREIDDANDAFKVERERLQVELSKSQAAQRDLEHSLLARTKSRDHLRERSDQLQRSYEDMSTRSKQIELTLESLRIWTLQEPGMSGQSSKPETKSVEHEKYPEVVDPVASPEPSVPGHFAESRGPSPLPMDSRPSEPPAVGGTLENAGWEAAEEKLKAAMVWKDWNAEIEAWRQHNAHQRELFQHEREAQAKEWEDERAELKRNWHAHQQLLQEQQDQEKADLHRILEATQTRFTARCGELEADNKDLREQVEQLKAQLASERSCRSRSTAELKAAAIRVEHESRHLRRLVEGDESDGPVYRGREGQAGGARAAGHVGRLE